MPFRTENKVREKNSARCKTTLTLERLETRAMFALDVLESQLQQLAALDQPPTVQSVSNPTVGSAPTVTTPLRSNTGTNVTTRTANLSVLGSDNAGEANLIYRWQTVSAPSGGIVSYAANQSNAAKSNTLTFNRIGSYAIRVDIMDQQGLSTRSEIRLNVIPTLTTLSFTAANGATLNPSHAVQVASTSAQIGIRALDQFSNPMPTLPNLTWSSPRKPVAANATTSLSGTTSTVRFDKAGGYTLQAVSGNRVATAIFNVNQQVTEIVANGTNDQRVSSNTANPVSNNTHRLSALVLDQFGAPMSRQPSIQWQTTSRPTGATVNLQRSGNAVTVTFNRVGPYTLTAIAGGRSLRIPLNVGQQLKSLGFTSINGAAVVAGTPIQLSGTNHRLNLRGIDQFGQAISTVTGVNWTTLSAPSGGSVSVSVSSGVATFNFTRAGNYVIRAASGSVNQTVSFNVTQSMTSLVGLTSTNQVIANGSALSVTGTSTRVGVRALDQFGQAMATQPMVTWSQVSVPTGGAVTISGSETQKTVNFNRAGDYGVRAIAGSRSVTINFKVVATLTTSAA